MQFNIKDLKGHLPLSEYPWDSDIDKLLRWLQNKDSATRTFCFDIVMSCAYIDATVGIEKNLEICPNINNQYNAHLGFINLCSPCYESSQIWQYQKAVKPQSGALGKLSSEVLLKFIYKLSSDWEDVICIGGTGYADAALLHKNGSLILAEVKSAPLLTYPFVFKIPNKLNLQKHQKVTLTNSQLKICPSALYIHDKQIIPLGEVGSAGWPFRSLINFLVDIKNESFVKKAVATWKEARLAYSEKNKSNPFYYLANASGSPPLIAKSRDNWPSSQVISDSKTSAGMDRTDDIKKAVYQTLKIGITVADYKNVKTAIISNLPAIRHGVEYVTPFVDVWWGRKDNFIKKQDFYEIDSRNLRYLFDYIITLENLNLIGGKNNDS